MERSKAKTNSSDSKIFCNFCTLDETKWGTSIHECTRYSDKVLEILHYLWMREENFNKCQSRRKIMIWFHSSCVMRIDIPVEIRKASGNYAGGVAWFLLCVNDTKTDNIIILSIWEALPSSTITLYGKENFRTRKKIKMKRSKFFISIMSF